MTVPFRLEVTVVVAVLACACSYGMKIDFSRLTHLRRTPLIAHKRGSECTGNPCPPDKPFLCKESFTCIALKFVCDETFDCDDGFDEDKAVCNAASRPSVEQLYDFLENENSWIIPKLFGGVEPEVVAHTLAVASDIDDLQLTLGLTDENVENLRKAFAAAMEGDERPLLKMDMPERSWNEVQYMLQQLLDSGFKV
ncbi:neuropeptide prohormone-4-like [Haliotis cracherodii]|uniref:neuropeptide prohormone-4-like n=1 Tax=Haliotis rufescens TaxID=6454 RepID=UPI001EB08C8C|nr:neuropeptide prohormone-4-like [Haliotis rufescens]WDR24975.1 neuropeptide prohormone-4 [Haliotis discus hannai]